MGSRINRKKKNNTRLVMFAIQYPFLHSFFILFFYLFIFFIFFFFIFLLRITLFIHYLFPSFTHARVVVGNWRPSVERLIVRGAFFRLIEIRRGREKQGKVYLEGREKKEEEKKKKKKRKKKRRRRINFQRSAEQKEFVLADCRVVCLSRLVSVMLVTI